LLFAGAALARSLTEYLFQEPEEKRMIVVKFCMALLILLPVASFARGDELKDEKKAQKGTWIPEEAEMAGRKFPEEARKAIKLELDADGNYTVTTGTGIDKGSVKLDLKAKPKAMDVISTEGANKGKTFLAIYELKGDTLKVCYDLSGKTRPGEFATKPGTSLFLVNYKRQQP
jgi:uncharacterized protein (TIGR03067 family)